MRCLSRKGSRSTYIISTGEGPAESMLIAAGTDSFVYYFVLLLSSFVVVFCMLGYVFISNS